MRIAVAMSGGVDSSSAALVLRDEGHEVIGITAWLWECASPASERACCGSAEALKKAKEAATSLGLRHEVVDLSAEFEREVVGPTVSAYAAGLTPNPCVLCNARVRFPYLATAARDLDAEGLATGHYARLGRGAERVSLLRGRDREHDQSYFLFAVAPADFEFARFPLGNWEKTQTRKLAADAAHPSAERLSSQDLCFTGGRAPGEL
ncbi:MAG: tRNA 2-thiouridine(34) synthase MnmA, partial [Planctomycetota bacterium]